MCQSKKLILIIILYLLLSFVMANGKADKDNNEEFTKDNSLENNVIQNQTFFSKKLIYMSIGINW